MKLNLRNINYKKDVELCHFPDVLTILEHQCECNTENPTYFKAPFFLHINKIL